MNLTDRRTSFREILKGKHCVRPGSVFDPISARIAEDIGFEAGMFAGSIASATILGAPDYIVITLTEFAQQINRICRSSTLPLLVDADHGYGNALNVKRTVEELETAGVAALTIEDTMLPRTFNVDKQQLVSIEEGIGKMKAALAGRQDSTLVIAARTSSISIEPAQQTIERIQAYERAGVDAIFLVGLKTREELQLVSSKTNLPILLGNTTEELNDTKYLASQGVRIALQGHFPFLAAVKATHDTLKALRDGVPPVNLKDKLATNELMDQSTRRENYDQWIKEFLS